MKFPASLLTLFFTLVVVNASNPHDHGLAARHSRFSARMSALNRDTPQKRCAGRRKTKLAAPPPNKEPTSSEHPAPKKQVADDNHYGGGGSSDGKILTGSSKCGASGAVAKTTKTSGPNGSIDYLNCGIDGDGWKPPFIHIQDVAVKSLSEAIKLPHSPFKPCLPFVDTFNRMGKEFGIPPIFLASFAMQESSCNPNTVGGGGEQGLMQITKDKCKGVPNCRDPEFNIHTGAKYFADTLNANKGDMLKSLGQYNGWYPGLTIKKATAARWSSCCRCQNNLDYLHQFLNGWCQGINAYDDGLGKYFNLDPCGH